jgi:hypothetical protein
MGTGDVARFEADRAALIDGSEPSAGDDLLGMQMDFDAYWFMSEVLEDVVVSSTGAAENLLDVRANARPGVSDDEIESDLVRVWTEKLRYGFAEAHVVTRTPEAVVLRAVTKIGPDGFYVTGTVTVART